MEQQAVRFADLVAMDLKCEYAVNPIGIDTTRPRLGWALESGGRGRKQTAYRILVSERLELLNRDQGEVWDSGKVISDRQNQIEYAGTMLQSRLCYYWKVCVWDQDGNGSEWSKAAYWEMGLLKAEDWQSSWIGCPEAEQEKNGPLFRRDWTIEGEILKARAYISGLGYYELYINGVKVGDHVLDPAQTDYEQRCFYVVYNIAEHMNKGQNTVGVILGNGWYHQNKVWNTSVMDYGKPKFVAQLVVTLSDGTEQILTSDEQWKTAPGPIVADNVYAGETYDARLELDGWANPGLDDNNWEQARRVNPPGGKLVIQMMPPIRKVKTIRPVRMTNPQPGVYVYDMGQNFAGWARLKASETEGTAIRLRFAETVDADGMVDTASTGVFATGVEQIDTYICKGGGLEIWQPRFTYHGYRYVEMTGVAGNPELDDLTGVVVHTDVEPAGSFECSDEMINKIQHAVLWTQLSNLHGVPTDCPARERCGWLGDTHVIAEMSIYNFDMAQFWSKYIHDIETSRRGSMPFDIAPGKRLCLRGVPDWSTAFIQLPWYLYVYYGDEQIVREHYSGMKLVLEQFHSQAKQWILYEGRGDWCPPGSIVPIETPVEITSTALFYLDCTIMSQMAKMIGHAEDSEKYGKWANRIKEAFIAAFYVRENYTFGSQTADSIALYLGLLPESDAKEVAASLADDVRVKHKSHLSTGIIGSRHLYGSLSQYGYGDVAYALLNQTTYPSIGHLFSKGATTIWENWEETKFNAKLNRVEHRSMSHPMQAGFGAWFYQGLAGIAPDPEQPGFKRIVLHPQIIESLHYSKAEYRSIHGRIASHWKRHEGTLCWDITIPPNTTAIAYFPAESADRLYEGATPIGDIEHVRLLRVENGNVVCEISSGAYHFEIG
jgi:alpha-L-rhamnosidase